MNTSILIFTIYFILCNSSDISNKSDDCATFDLCRTGDELFRTCSCDRECRHHASCCSDSDHAPHMAPPNSSEFQCQSDRTVTPVYAKRACQDKFVTHPHQRWECEEAESDRADVLENALVTSLRTGVTYWNRVCGICNGENQHDLRFWTIQVTCPAKHGDTKFNQNYIEEHLHYDRDIEEWGLKVEDGFKVCSLSFAQPRRMTGVLSYCAPNLISTCPTGYPDEGVVEMCHAYHAERRRKGTSHEYFRNAHCALCNGVEEAELECVGRNYGQIKGPGGREQVLVSFDQKWLHKMEDEKYKCSRNNTWDPFTHRCRRLPLDLWKEVTAKTMSTSHASRTTFRYFIYVFVICAVSFNKYVLK